MSRHYSNHYNIRETPQTEKIPGSDQVENSAGGYSFAVDDWNQLERFLILGSEGGSYYASEKALTVENAEAVRRCLQADGPRVVKTILDISESGRAPKNDPALFVLAMASAPAFANHETRKLAYDNLQRIARIGTHLFLFMEYRKAFAGRGQGLHKALQRWYQRDAGTVAYQMIKYRQRHNWTHRDMLRTCRPAHQPLFRWAVKDETGPDLPKIIYGFNEVQQNPENAPALIRHYDLPREALPTECLNKPEVWEALLEKMPMTAMIRNLGNMGKVGLLTPMSNASVEICKRVTDSELLHKARIHPLAVLVALKTYESGTGYRGSGEWPVVAQIVDALDAAFYKAFKTIEPTGKRILIGLDVSSSMTFSQIAGMPGITPRVGSAAMCLVTAATELNYTVMAFAQEFQEISLSPRERLDDVIHKVSNLNFGGTDCALPMLYAAHYNLKVDAFLVYTDSETWAGHVHPIQALRAYRDKTGISAKLIVIGMVSNGFSIADPKDAGMLDVVGFDTAAPAVMADFIR